jgi:glycosyltransferase involved in cell wall biosynthesis
MEKTLSVVVPIHKSREGDSDSPLKQWVKNIDRRCSLILSIDHTEEGDALTSWCKKELPIAVDLVHGKFGNPGQTRNNGLSRVTSEWLAFADSDDYFDSISAIEAIEDLNDSYDLIICNYLTINKSSGKIFKGRNPKCLADLFPELGFWRVLYRSNFVKNLEFPHYRMGEDQIYFSRVLARNPKIAYSPRIIYRYFSGSPDQLSQSKSSMIELEQSIKHMRNELMQSSNCVDFRKLILLRQEISYSIKMNKRVTVIHLAKQLNFREISMSMKCIKNFFFWYLKRKVM